MEYFTDNPLKSFNCMIIILELFFAMKLREVYKLLSKTNFK